MIKGLFETHIDVEDLERSIDFYKRVMGLTLCHFEATRRIAFFWVGPPKGAMLGLWEKPKDQICLRHFAFRCEVDDVLNKSIDFLNAHQLKSYNFLKSEDAAPMVFSWMPAIAIYFNDPDGNSLEYIAILNGEAKPELGVVSYKDWISVSKKFS